MQVVFFLNSIQPMKKLLLFLTISNTPRLLASRINGQSALISLLFFKTAARNASGSASYTCKNCCKKLNQNASPLPGSPFGEPDLEYIQTHFKNLSLTTS